MNDSTPPLTPEALLQKARRFAGKKLGDFFDEDDPNFTQNKGGIGILTELLLGATAKSKPMPDFPELQIELKTLPITPDGTVLESTYVCTAALQPLSIKPWYESLVSQKLNHVLWVPVIGERKTPMAERLFATAFLWQPNVQEMSVLQQDYDNAMNAIRLGDFHLTSAHHGEILQLRPKAQNGTPMHTVLDADGMPHKINALGFYLRAKFTQLLLNKRAL